VIDTLVRHRTLPAVLLVLVVALGGYLRFTNLGLNTLASDEMNHYFVGHALEETGKPVLPSGTVYTRGLEYSALVAKALPRFSQMEVAVRFPSAVIGTACLVVFALITWRLTGPWASLIATTLLVIYPEALRLSRFGRFYTLQLFAGLLGFYAGWRLVRDPLTPENLNSRRLLRDWVWALLTLVALGYAASVQLTTLSVAAGLALWIAIIGVRDLRVLGRDAWRWSVPWQLTTLGLALAVGAVALRFETVQELIQQALTMPMWARLSSEGPGPVTAYYRALSDDYPLIVSLSPVIFLVAIFRYPRLGGLLLAWFAVPLLLHSIVFPWKSERYVLLAIPALFIASGIAGAAAGQSLYHYLVRNLERSALPPKPSAHVLMAVIGLAAMITNPAFNVARRSVNEVESHGWAESRAIIQRDTGLAALPIGSAQPLVALHYWGELDFTVQRALLESWRRDSTTEGFDNPYRMKSMGSPDVYAGRPTLTTPQAIRQRFAKRGSVLIGIDQKYLTFDNIEPALREVLEREARELCQKRCGTMNLYHWTFGRVNSSPAQITPSRPE
jgi:hypothetical protein